MERGARVAIVGAGPGGLFAADELLRSEAVESIDVIDRLPTPFGLLRYAVAPDHPRIKSMITVLSRVFTNPVVRFLGGLNIGSDVRHADLARCYDVVLYTTGAAKDRTLGIPGEDLAGSVPANDLVAWYSGHPDSEQPDDVLQAESVAVIGAGNVALDIMRILAKSVDELQPTDIPAAALKALANSAIRDIHVIIRNGPDAVKFTIKELLELGELLNADVRVDRADLDLKPRDDASPVAIRNLFEDWAAREPRDKPRTIHFHFWSVPESIIGAERVEGLLIARVTPTADGLQPSGKVEDVPVQAVVRAVGYRSTPLADLPFDAQSHTVPHDEGRVVDADRHHDGVYVAGWIKRGPTGVVGTNKADASGTVKSIIADLLELTRNEPEGRFDDVLQERGIVPVSHAGWLAIDEEERRLGAVDDRDRAKFADWDELLRIGASAGSNSKEETA